MDSGKDQRERMYRSQDMILDRLVKAGIPQSMDIVLSGGTGLSRAWLNHCVSYDLDFFIYGDSFSVKGGRVVEAIAPASQRIIQRADNDFLFEMKATPDPGMEWIRIQIVSGYVFGLNVRFDIENTGNLRGFPVDSVRNIFSNKVAALIDRQAPEDMADIWAIMTMRDGLRISDILHEARQKGANVTIPELHRVIVQFDYSSMDDSIAWMRHQDVSSIRGFMMKAAEELLFTGDFSSSA